MHDFSDLSTAERIVDQRLKLPLASPSACGNFIENPHNHEPMLPISKYDDQDCSIILLSSSWSSRFPSFFGNCTANNIAVYLRFPKDTVEHRGNRRRSLSRRDLFDRPKSTVSPWAPTIMIFCKGKTFFDKHYIQFNNGDVQSSLDKRTPAGLATPIRSPK